jgi:hypothetical protein
MDSSSTLIVVPPLAYTDPSINKQSRELQVIVCEGDGQVGIDIIVHTHIVYSEGAVCNKPVVWGSENGYIRH